MRCVAECRTRVSALGERASLSCCLFRVLLPVWLTWVSSHAQGQPAGWTNHFHGPVGGSDHVSALAVGADGTVYVAGTCNSAGSYHDYAAIAYSSGSVALWTNYYDGPGNWEDYASGVAVDSNGRVFVTGYSQNVHLPPSNFDYATIAYSREGMALWTNRYNGPSNGDDYARAVAVDTNGNVFVTGTCFSSQSDAVYATIAYSNDGVALWTNLYAGPGRDHEATAIAVGRNGNVFVTGYSVGDTSYYDIATVAYSGAGVPLWTNRYNGPGNSWDQGNAIGVDGNGNVFVTGFSFGTGGLNALKDYVTLAYSSAGTPLWTNRYHGPGARDDVAHAIGVGRNGEVVVTGESYGTNTGYDYATILYSNAGVPLWTNRYNGSSTRNDYAYAVGTDAAGNVFVTGSSVEATNFSSAYATVAYSSGGMPLWTNRYRGSGIYSDVARALAVDRSGNIIVAGDSANANNLDFVTIQYAAVPPAAPLIRVVRSGPGAVFQLSWPSAFSLEQNTNLAKAGSWMPYTGGVEDNGSGRSASIEPSAGTRFFRLTSQR